MPKAWRKIGIRGEAPTDLEGFSSRFITEGKKTKKQRFQDFATISGKILEKHKNCDFQVFESQHKIRKSADSLVPKIHLVLSQSSPQ